LRVDLYEYQARDLFEKYEVPVLPGIIADTPEEAKAAAEKLGGVVVVKAQVKTGGRGKAGGVKVAKTPTRRTRPRRRSSASTSRATSSSAS
jgi:succinyl-CoA synthetase beta subunit